MPIEDLLKKYSGALDDGSDGETDEEEEDNSESESSEEGEPTCSYVIKFHFGMHDYSYST